MTWLISQMLLCLLLAFALGLLLGWLLGRGRDRGRLEDTERDWRSRLDDCEGRLRSTEAERDGWRSKHDALGAEPAPEPVLTATPAADPPTDDTSTAGVLGVAAGLAGLPPEDHSAKDDLKKIEGIGPKIESLLNADGIMTWTQLASAEAEHLRGILLRAGERYRVHDPATWPEQAALAAAGRWDELATLQDALDGGRRT